MQSVVFIDMDHTLLEGPFETVVFPEILGEIGRQAGLEYGSLLRMARAENLKRQSDPAFSAVAAMDWDAIFPVLAHRFGVKLHTTALELVRANPGLPGAFLHPGAREALEHLACGKPGRALVLATKGLRKYQLPVLEALEILPFFDDVLTPDTGQALKGSLAFYGNWPFRTRLQIMVGDTYTEDVVPAHGFGFKTIWRAHPAGNGAPEDRASGDPFARPHEPGICPPNQEVRPDAVILALSELPAVVERLEHGSHPA